MATLKTGYKGVFVATPATAMTIVCLLPARNAEADLPGFFASAERFADAVVALDDGSTDGTADLLAAHPLVRRLITNPTRPDYRGWNDAANRNALLRAAAALAPEWIVSIDADERLDPSDAAALRRFVATDALPGVAYGFRCYAMQRDLAHYGPDPIWVYRLFAFAPGQRFPDQLLHVSPVPTSISRRAFVPTGLRIQHLGGLTGVRRRARYEKYRQAYPDCRFWPDYAALLREPEPAALRVWQPLPPDAPILAATNFTEEAFAHDGGDHAPEAAPTCALSVVVLGDGPEVALQRSVDSALEQACPEPFEVLLAAGTGDRIAAAVSRRHPQLRPVWARSAASPGALRNAGLRAASGDAILFLSSDFSLAPGALEALAAAHRQGFALVAPAIEDRARNRGAVAVYATTYRRDHPRRAAGITEQAPRLCSYRLTLLLEGSGFPEEPRAGEEIAVNRELAWRGFLTYREPAAVVRFHGDAVTGPALIGRSFHRGAATARLLLDAHRERGEMVDRRFLRDHVFRSIPRRVRLAAASGRAGWPALVAAETASWAGEWSRLLRPERGKAMVLAARPAGLALVVLTTAGVATGIALVRFDLPARRATVVVLPPDLRIEAVEGELLRLDDALGVGPSRSDPAGVQRFGAHDAVGRPFALDLDDLLSLDVAQLLGDGPTPTSVDDWLHRLNAPRTLLHLVLALRSGDRIASTLARRSLVLGMLRIRSFQRDAVSVVHVSVADAVDGIGTLDQDTVDLVRHVLGRDRRQRPPSQRDRLKQIQWA